MHGAAIPKPRREIPCPLLTQAAYFAENYRTREAGHQQISHHHDLGADFHAVVEVADVVVAHADAA